MSGMPGTTAGTVHAPDDASGVPFRIIAVAGDVRRIGHIAELASRWAGIPFGLMLRDPGHRPASVELLAAHALSCRLPANLTLMTNFRRVAGIRWVHCTSAQLGEPDHREISAGAGPGRFGCSVHDVGEARRAVAAGAAYVTFSPIFPTGSKPGHPGAGMEALRDICSMIQIPVFALGGVTAGRVVPVLEAGAYGIASISLFDPMATVSLDDLLERLAERWRDEGRR